MGNQLRKSDEDGQVIELSIVSQEITERSQLLARPGTASIWTESTEAQSKSAERFHVLVQTIKDYAILMLDPQGRVASWNAGAERNTGYSEREILGQNVSVFYTAEDIAQGKLAGELRTAVADGRSEVEGWRVRKDGSRFWADVDMTALYDPEGRLAGFARVTRDVTERKEVEEALLATKEDLADRLADFTRLYDLAGRLSRTTELKSAVDEVLAAVTSLQQTTSGVVMLLDGETGELYPLDSVGLGDADLDLIRRVPVGTGACGVAVAERRLVAIEDVEQEPGIGEGREAWTLGDYRGVCSVPLLAPRDEIIGAIVTYFTEPHGPSDRELRQVQLYAHLAAGFLANARLCQDAQDTIRKRDELLASVYDSLRDPLAAIKQCAHLMRAEIDESAKTENGAIADGLTTIESLATRLTRQIKGLAAVERGPVGSSLPVSLHPSDEEVMESILAARLALPNRTGPEDATDPPDSGTTRASPGHNLAHSWHEDERARFLRTVPPFRSLPPDALRFTASVAQPRRVKRGEFVFLEGESLETVKVVAEGQVALRRETPGGREVLLRIIGPGETFGIVAIGTALVHVATAVAQVDTLYLTIPSDEFLKLLKTHPAFARSIIRLLARGQHDAESRICILQTENAERRVAWALLRLLDQHRRDRRTNGRDDLPLLREDLALLAGTNVGTVSRTLSAWARNGILDGGRKHVVIRDDRTLRALATGSDDPREDVLVH